MFGPAEQQVTSRRSGLQVVALRVDAVGRSGDIVSDISFSASLGELVGIVGESGSGKTTVALALLGYAKPGMEIGGGSVQVGELDILALGIRERRRVRGRVIAYVPQNPAASLNPRMRVGRQLEEMLEAHRPGDRRKGELLETAYECAQLSQIQFARRYPHELSGGQQQRVAIAMALVCRPELVVMDEPTTGLDVLTQDRLLEVIRNLRFEHRTTIVYVSHDLGVIRNLADHIIVMYGGRIMEAAPTEELFRRPRHPYTRRLLEAIPRVAGPKYRLRGLPGSAIEPWNRPIGCPFSSRCDYEVAKCWSELPPLDPAGEGSVRCWRWQELEAAGENAGAVGQPIADAVLVADPGVEPLLRIDDLRAGYRRHGLRMYRQDNESLAVDGVSLDVWEGSSLAVVGESGSGKTTLARCVSGLHAPLSGGIWLDGAPLAPLARNRPHSARRSIQIVFQDPDGSLNPRMTVGQTLGRPLRQFFKVGRRERRARVVELLEQVHLPTSFLARPSRELSGGEKQRVALARALAAEPRLLLCDEITSALDVVVQATIIELLHELKTSLRMTFVFVSHDLGVVRAISDRVVVLRRGRVRETAETNTLFSAPEDDYTRRLLLAVPKLRADDYPLNVDAPAHERSGPSLDEHAGGE